MRRSSLLLLLCSFTVLFQELALIRWLPGTVRVLAYFPNLILIAAFLGLGIGCLRSGKRSLLWLWPVSLAVLLGTAALLSRIAFTQNSESEHLWLLYGDLGRDALVVHDVRSPILGLFLLATLTFVAPGQIEPSRSQQ